MRKTTYCLALIFTVSALFLTGASFASDTDDRIESAAKQSYVFKTYLKGDDVTIQSKGGAVTLTGTVSEESSKALAQETVSGLPGVISVDNKLVVKNTATSANMDMLLANKVKFTLFFHRNVSASSTEVFAKDGVITLRGEATSDAQKDLATEYAKDVEGVKSVNNEMAVLPAPVNPDEKTMGQKMDAMGDSMKAGGKKMGAKMDAMGESIDDASITAMVKSTLLYHRSTSAIHTTVTTKDGVVQLAGEAKNAAEKDLATKFASDVHGVKMVVNNMIIK